MIFAIIFMLVGFIVFILVSINQPKVEIPKSGEFEFIENEINEWLNFHMMPFKKEVQMPSSVDTKIIVHPLEKPQPCVILAYNSTEMLKEMDIAT